MAFSKTSRFYFVSKHQCSCRKRSVLLFLFRRKVACMACDNCILYAILAIAGIFAESRFAKLHFVRLIRRNFVFSSEVVQRL